MKLTPVALAFAALVMPLHAAKERGHRAEKKDHPRPQAAFHRKDKDKDGQLSKEEFTAGARNGKRAGKRFRKEDTDHNGELSRKEFKASAQTSGVKKEKPEGTAHTARHHRKKHE